MEEISLMNLLLAGLLHNIYMSKKSMSHHNEKVLLGFIDFIQQIADALEKVCN